MGSIRILTADDAAAYQALRLYGLRESPAAFGSTYENEVDIPLPDVAERLARGTGGEDVAFGAFDDGGALVGVIALHRQTGPKSRHRGSVWGMYVAPQARGRGVGRALLDALIAHARTVEGLERLTL
ncbi:MAG TPA: GNAT family N-acetyltransferase, partial [Longimicrobium sp.]|nr:GNAT family N-acetyltransferase [Longimicrobium sp.]